MHSAKVLSFLALAATTIAAPAPYRRHRVHAQGNVVYKTVVHTAYATVIAGQPQPTPAPAPLPISSVAPAPAPISSAEPVAEPAPVTSAIVEVTPTPEPVPSSTVVVVPSSTVVETPAATATGYMAIVDEYRTKLGLSKLTYSSKLEANSLKTAQDGHGQMVHQLLDGSYAQVLAPGGPADFLHVFVGGWLCERPDLAGLDGECATQSKGWEYDSTGHADILTSASYHTIGCANAGGIWGCDLGF